MPMSSSRVTADGASLVCRVDSTRWPGERGLDRDVRGLEVADLAHHDDVRVLAQERAQGGGERQAEVVARRDLVDAVQLELDRVLDGADVDRRAC